MLSEDTICKIKLKRTPLNVLTKRGFALDKKNSP